MNLEGWSTRCGDDLITSLTLRTRIKEKCNKNPTYFIEYSKVTTQVHHSLHQLDPVVFSGVHKGCIPRELLKKRIRNEQGNCCCWDYVTLLRLIVLIHGSRALFIENTRTLEKYKARLS